MAYINAETVRNIRNALKAEFPEVKFSVRKDGFSSVNVNIMKAGFDIPEGSRNVNHYWIDSHFGHDEELCKFLKRVDEIIRTEGNWYDNSDSMTDYFDTAFYYHIQFGKWDRPYQQTEVK